jgi:RNA polymerase I-specific transcription initiation factor RRN3
MVSSNVTFILPVFQYLVKSFRLLAELPKSTSSRTLHAADDDYRQNANRIHHGIRNLLSLVPTGQSELFPILAYNFPYKKADIEIQQTYISELFKICEYFPGIQSNILKLIITKCLEIDVEIVIEESGEVKITEIEAFETIETNDASNNIFSLDETETVKTQGFRQRSSDNHKISDEVSIMADKLDVLLHHLIQYLTNEINKNKRDVNLNLFQTLLNIFEEKVLTTYRSKFVQFILFYVAGITHQSGYKFSEMFASRLLKLFLNPNVASMTKQSSVLYFASYISRANFLSIRFVR